MLIMIIFITFIYYFLKHTYFLEFFSIHFNSKFALINHVWFVHYLSNRIIQQVCCNWLHIKFWFIWQTNFASDCAIDIKMYVWNARCCKHIMISWRILHQDWSEISFQLMHDEAFNKFDSPFLLDFPVVIVFTGSHSNLTCMVWTSVLFCAKVAFSAVH